MPSEPWWKERRREQEKYATELSLMAWKAGISADQNPDDVAQAFDRGISARAFVDRKLEEKRAEKAAMAARLDEQRQLESTCHYENSEHPCWGEVFGRGYDGTGPYATYIYACYGHSEMHSDAVYITEDDERIEVT